MAYFKSQTKIIDRKLLKFTPHYGKNRGKWHYPSKRRRRWCYYFIVFFLDFARKDEQLFFHNFHFFPAFKFLSFSCSFCCCCKCCCWGCCCCCVKSISGIIFWLVVQQPCFLLVLAKLNYFDDVSIGENKFKMRFIVYSKPIGFVADFWKE